VLHVLIRLAALLLTTGSCMMEVAATQNAAAAAAVRHQRRLPLHLFVVAFCHCCRPPLLLLPVHLLPLPLLLPVDLLLDDRCCCCCHRC
jgi:hypothetical protein